MGSLVACIERLAVSLDHCETRSRMRHAVLLDSAKCANHNTKSRQTGPGIGMEEIMENPERKRKNHRGMSPRRNAGRSGPARHQGERGRSVDPLLAAPLSGSVEPAAEVRGSIPCSRLPMILEAEQPLKVSLRTIRRKKAFAALYLASAHQDRQAYARYLRKEGSISTIVY